MIIRSAEIIASAPDLASAPSTALPEIAFIGRSNVGKSSLVNMLTRKKALAKVSATPGKTRLINFFAINGDWTLVDLPGYGYAKVGREERGRFGDRIADYLRGRPNLRKTLVLIDSRLSPQQIDLDFLEGMIHFDLPFALVFTKTDKLSPTAVQRNIDAFLSRLGEFAEEPVRILTCSAQLGHGRVEILNTISQILAEPVETKAAEETEDPTA